MLEVNRGERDIMTVKKEKWDGRSRPTNDIYSKRWEEIFGKEDTSKELDKDEQDYLDSLKEKL
jgi:hypothetical protein